MKQVVWRVVLAGSMLLGAAGPLASHAAEVAQGPVKPDAKAGEKLYNEGDPARGVVACISCHGSKGNSELAVNPNLAAQPHEYLYKQLVEFKPKEGETMAARRGPDGAPSTMTGLAMPLTDADMRNVSLYLDEQPLTKPASASDEELVARGEMIWRGGIAAQNVPACAACHSADGAGIPSQYPRLAGQYASYLEDQLKLFRAGHRANSEMMNQIAYRMSDEDIKAVSDYAAGLR
ncbi:MAG: c-type cytochrome [Orrella sp.]